MRGRPPRVMLVLSAGPEILSQCLEKAGVDGWNIFVKSLFDRNLVFTSWNNRKRPPPISLFFNFAGADLSGRNLDRTDLSFAWLVGADFSGSSLRGSQLSCIREAVFKKSDLRGAIIQSDLTGTDFSESQLDGASFTECSFDSGKPPIGLPEDILVENCLIEADICVFVPIVEFIPISSATRYFPHDPHLKKMSGILTLNQGL